MPPPIAALPGWLKPANRVVRALHRIGLPVGTIRVLTVPGRTTGAPRSTPVSPLRVDGREFVIAALPNCDWARNARAAGRGQLRRGRRVRSIALTEVRDADLRREVMRAFPREVPHGVAFFVRIGLVEGADPDRFGAVADRVAVFEITDAR
ncbi:nitroreductase/quinone reductase family protein [Pseudonocardia humida]|uniref:Nitroreductase family deazaflavin-dependent oxidoreductase n=1 Tax=Pseudonocardia humida TaxID=2800819 RepID=A0ABT1A0J5_9PSEU|nr:nitroreductase/quinone reductase family protein [Pseudonocardia humida]MCO1656520.1 nitroreductase family deazaflavin-dependent oxidoreductase [Pseudonocardia humida]